MLYKMFLRLKRKLVLSSTFLWCCLLNMLHKVVLTFEFLGEILKCDHSMKVTEQYFPVVLFIEYAVQDGSNF